MSNFDFKVYTNDLKILNFLADTFKLKLEYLGEVGKGYVSNGKYLRVFCQDSYVDLNTDIEELPDYKRGFTL